MEEAVALVGATVGESGWAGGTLAEDTLVAWVGWAWPAPAPSQAVRLCSPAIDLSAIDLSAIDLSAIDLSAIDLSAITLPSIDSITDFSITGSSEIGLPFLSARASLTTTMTATLACGPAGDGSGSTSATEHERQTMACQPALRHAVPESFFAGARIGSPMDSL